MFDAERTFRLVVLMFALAVASELPNEVEALATSVPTPRIELDNDDELFKTLLLVVRIELDSELEALARLLVSVESEVALAKIDAESDDDAEVTRLFVPVIAERTEETGLVKVSTKRLPTDPGVTNVEVAAPHI